MLKTIRAEWMKTRHNKFFLISALVAVGYPALVSTNEWRMRGQPDFQLPVENLIASMQDISITIVLNILSGLLVILLFQKEYGEKTIIGQLTAPISRTEFLVGKLTIWGVWHMVLTVLMLLSSVIGIALVRQGEMTMPLVLQAARNFLFHGFIDFWPLLPLLLVAVLQRSVFYPGMLLTLLFTGVASLATVLRGNLMFLLPWSAARVIGITDGLPQSPLVISFVSILVCALVGLIGAFWLFPRQRI